ncbi:MAG: CtpF protein, partial [Mesorhizobium sp.]
MTMSNLAYDAPLDGGDTSQQDIAAMQALRPVPRISIQAFCETEGVASPVRLAGEDRRMA